MGLLNLAVPVTVGVIPPYPLKFPVYAQLPVV